jgi:hypothetical protein
MEGTNPPRPLRLCGKQNPAGNESPRIGGTQFRQHQRILLLLAVLR